MKTRESRKRSLAPAEIKYNKQLRKICENNLREATKIKVYCVGGGGGGQISKKMETLGEKVKRHRARKETQARPSHIQSVVHRFTWGQNLCSSTRHCVYFETTVASA